MAFDAEIPSGTYSFACFKRRLANIVDAISGKVEGDVARPNGKAQATAQQTYTAVSTQAAKLGPERIPKGKEEKAAARAASGLPEKKEEIPLHAPERTIKRAVVPKNTATSPDAGKDDKPIGRAAASSNGFPNAEPSKKDGEKQSEKTTVKEAPMSRASSKPVDDPVASVPSQANPSSQDGSAPAHETTTLAHILSAVASEGDLSTFSMFRSHAVAAYQFTLEEQEDMHAQLEARAVQAPALADGESLAQLEKELHAAKKDADVNEKKLEKLVKRNRRLVLGS